MFTKTIKKIVSVVALFVATTGLALALDVNSATQAELDTLKGIGPVKAKAIIEERAKNGNFKDANDLATRVKGLGDKSVASLVASGLTVNGKADASTKAKVDTKSATNSKDAKDAKHANAPKVAGIDDGTNKNVKSTIITEVSKPAITKTAAEAKKEQAQSKELTANIKAKKEEAKSSASVNASSTVSTSGNLNAIAKTDKKAEVKVESKTHAKDAHKEVAKPSATTKASANSATTVAPAKAQ
jgi:competence protein ComEA